MYEKVNKVKVDIIMLVIVVGLICGDGVWIILLFILVLMKVNFLICMYFYSFSNLLVGILY